MTEFTIHQFQDKYTRDVIDLVLHFQMTAPARLFPLTISRIC